MSDVHWIKPQVTRVTYNKYNKLYGCVRRPQSWHCLGTVLIILYLFICYVNIHYISLLHARERPETGFSNFTNAIYIDLVYFTSYVSAKLLEVFLILPMTDITPLLEKGSAEILNVSCPC